MLPYWSMTAMWVVCWLSSAVGSSLVTGRSLRGHRLHGLHVVHVDKGSPLGGELVGDHLLHRQVIEGGVAGMWVESTRPMRQASLKMYWY